MGPEDRHDPYDELWEQCEILRKRAEQAERDRDELAAALNVAWETKWFPSRWTTEEKAEAVEACAVMFINDTGITRDLFDRLVKPRGE